MKAKLLISSLLLGVVILAFAKEKDPVLMTINGKQIKLSEFEYLYHKNNQQQVEKESLDQYVERFVLYKQKVADAEAAGIDTTMAFVKEFEGYQKDLAAPYMTEDSTYYWQLLNEAYDRYKKEIDIDHFMLPVGATPEANAPNLERMDSLRRCILNGESWEELVDRYSSDPSKQRNHGHYGYVSSGMFPYDFENVVYSTPVGEVSKPFETQYGIHMIRVNQVRDRNDVHAKHILKLFPQNATDEQKDACKAQIDSIYALLKAGANFEELAKAESQDGSAKRGGDLSWFSRGRMVQPFEDIAFGLADGAISEPFATQFGYHIIKKEAHGVAPLADVRPALENAIKRDGRMRKVEERRLNDLKSKYNYRLDPAFESMLDQVLTANGRFDSTFVAENIKGVKTPLFTYGAKESVPVKSLMAQLNPTANIADVAKAKEYVMSKVDALAETALKDYDAHELVKSNPEYRNLLNEYRDGMMLFEISNRRVWKAAAKDTLGLDRYYAENRGKYTWDEPHFKGIILSAKNDSVLNLVKADVMRFGADTLTDALHNKYGNDIRMERMVVKRGENQFADYLAFHVGEKPERKGYPEFMIIEGGVINQPEEMADVRGAVTSDYQDVLEQRWKEELAKKYPAKINKKVLKQVK
ncbi:MAG: peptidylprolyl isomerase [Muribaculaceae bacterium]|nr:peptidylprolyl isomerase [Muribaculaceae bacterium]